MNEVRMKYNEDQIINEIKAYVGLTYEQHYSKSDDGFQVQDVLRKADQVINLAGLMTPDCSSNPILGAKVNILGSINIFEAAKKK